MLSTVYRYAHKLFVEQGIGAAELGARISLSILASFNIASALVFLSAVGLKVGIVTHSQISFDYRIIGVLTYLIVFVTLMRKGPEYLQRKPEISISGYRLHILGVTYFVLTFFIMYLSLAFLELVR